MEQKPVYRPSALVGVIVIVLCLVAMVVIYKLTVGQKVSREAPTSPETVVTPPGWIPMFQPLLEGVKRLLAAVVVPLIHPK